MNEIHFPRIRLKIFYEYICIENIYVQKTLNTFYFLEKKFIVI